mmetsp:Transcript_69239/g.225532  ORF Transcript_69239/g.225532 Transcript_69239/m.225532 type:complete len:303 (-) Transcript_69239:915-1823(-)
MPVISFTRRTDGRTSGLFTLSTAAFNIKTTSSAMSPMFTGALGRGIGHPACFLFSCCARSITFVTKSSNRAAQPRIMPSCRFIPLPASVSSKAVVRPIMPWRGLRISCDNMASKAVFWSCTSLSVATSERSWPMAMIPATSPSGVDFGTNAIANCRTVEPGFASSAVAHTMEISINALLEPASPVLAISSVVSPRALARVFRKVSSRVSLLAETTSSVRSLPLTSSYEKPVSAWRFAFHCVIRPSRSSAKTGAFAPLIMFCRSKLAEVDANHKRRTVSTSWRFRTIANIGPCRTFSVASPYV